MLGFGAVGLDKLGQTAVGGKELLGIVGQRSRRWREFFVLFIQKPKKIFQPLLIEPSGKPDKIEKILFIQTLQKELEPFVASYLKIAGYPCIVGEFTQNPLHKRVDGHDKDIGIQKALLK